MFETIFVNKAVLKEILFIIGSSKLKHLISCDLLSLEFGYVAASERPFALNRLENVFFLRYLILPERCS